MTIINHEYYVSPEIANLLKEAGFVWEVKTYYNYLSPYDEYNLEFDSTSTNYNHLNNADFSAPTLDVAQRWLREVMNVPICTSITAKGAYIVEIYTKINGYWCPTNALHTGLEYENFDTYEKAQEAGIEKVLEIILEKGE